MGAQAPAAGSSASPWADPFCQSPSSGGDIMDTSAPSSPSPWHQDLVNSGVPALDRNHEQYDTMNSAAGPRQYASTIPPLHDSSKRDIPQQLVHVLINSIPGSDGVELGDAFLYAAELPPVTKQSLSELDIHNILSNIKLRHDVNFDRDLSFRPNLDGPKGHEKQRQSTKYWRALVAELELYARLFHGTSSLWSSDQASASHVAQHVQRRIPHVFETVHDVLRSLVPSHDHAQVDEQLDVPMLMQAIERGVCDLVKLAQWMALLLKEHCAPMRDVWVDEMLNLIQSGVAEKNSDLIVSGLRKLLGILEAMKLDVANHQIRNLKMRLIEDTVNFEKHHHLERLVNGRSRVTIDAAHKWWARAMDEFSSSVLFEHTNSSRFQVEVLIRALVAVLFSSDSHANFPDTFYLDQDRLRVIKSEIHSLVHFDMCYSMFAHLLEDFGWSGPVLPHTINHLRSSLSAIVGEGATHAPQSWVQHSEAISLELYRQAHELAGRLPAYGFDNLSRANDHLLHLFNTSYSAHASALAVRLLPQILASASKHHTSSPMNLYNSLVTQPPLPPQHSFTPVPLHNTNTSSSSTDRLTSLSNRITHVAILHWRTWGAIVYVPEYEAVTPLQPPPLPMPPSQATSEWPSSASPNVALGTSTLKTVKTGEPPESGHTKLA